MRRSAAALLLGALIVAGCGKQAPAAPNPVPAVLAPVTVLDGDLQLHPNDSPETAAAFHQDDNLSLISDGKLWEVRRNDRLVGTLEIATLKPNVDVARASVRRHITSPILVGATSSLRLAGQEVSTVTRTDGLSTLVWFGRGLMEIVQVKDQQVTGPQLAQAIIEYQQTQPQWSPLAQLYTPV